MAREFRYQLPVLDLSDEEQEYSGFESLPRRTVVDYPRGVFSEVLVAEHVVSGG